MVYHILKKVPPVEAFKALKAFYLKASLIFVKKVNDLL